MPENNTQRQKGALVYVLLLKRLKGVWRVFFFPSFFFSEIGFTRRRAVSLHLWMKSMWLASRTAGSFSTAPADICSWFVQQILEQGEGLWCGRGKGGGVRVRVCFFFFFFKGRYLRVLKVEGEGHHGIYPLLWSQDSSWPVTSPSVLLNPPVGVNTITWLPSSTLHHRDASCSRPFMLECWSVCHLWVRGRGVLNERALCGLSPNGEKH